jgi:hypothetical protein
MIASKPLRQFVCCAIVTVVALLAILYFRPFAPRYQGKTVAEYLDSSGEEPVPDDVVRAFGMAAIPEICASCRHSRIAFKLARYLPRLFSRYALGQRLDRQRQAAAYMWLYNLRTQGYPVIGYLAEQKDRMNLLNQLVHCPEALPAYAAQSTNLFLREEALRLLSQKSTNGLSFRLSAAEMVTFP